jgi:hypothetical protein
MTDFVAVQLFVHKRLYFPSAAVNAQHESASLLTQKHEPRAQLMSTRPASTTHRRWLNSRTSLLQTKKM